MMPTALNGFIRAAKLATYAAQGNSASVEPLLPATQQLEFIEGDLLYRDIYAGMNFFVGQELVYNRKSAVWSMVYSGGLVVEASTAATAEIYKFLRIALSQCPLEVPLRGPGLHRIGEFVYDCEVHGTLDRFTGLEQISLAGSKVYELQFSGGALQ